MADDVLELAMRVGADGYVLFVRGEIDMQTGPVVRAALLALLEAKACIVIDLREVEFMDSSGLGAIAEGWSAAVDAGVESFVIAGPLRPAVRTVFEVTKLGSNIQIRDDLDLDLDHWRGRTS